jgi:hypothetical protein
MFFWNNLNFFTRSAQIQNLNPFSAYPLAFESEYQIEILKLNFFINGQSQ